MAALFTAASTQYLANTAPSLPSTGYPFTVGMWVSLAAVGASARTLFSFSDTATTNNYLLVRMTATETVQCTASAGGTESSSTTAASMVAGRWHFIMAQFISATNRRLWVPGINGFSTQANQQSTTSRVPTGLDTITIGALQTSGGVTEPWDGSIGELWIANSTFEDSGSAGNFFAIAQGGPFAFPHIANKIVEYHSFRKDLSSDTFDNEEDFLSIPGTEIITNTNGVTVGPHPPLPYWYVKPGQVIRNLTI